MFRIFQKLTFITVLCLTVTLLFVTAQATLAAANTGAQIITGVLISLLSSEAMQGFLAILLVGLLAYLIQRYAWIKNVANLGIIAYEYAEQQGIAQNLKGYAKFDPFMDKFIAAYQEKFGNVPSPQAKGIAVQAMEQKVAEEHPGK